MGWVKGLPILCPEFAKPPLEVVEWVDSQISVTSWTALEDIAPDAPAVGLMLTAGWVIRENEQAVLIASSLGGIDGRHTAQVCNVMTIPKAAIRSRRRITQTQKRSR